MRTAALTDIGLLRKKNEDAYYIDPERAIFVLADGMGAFRGGEIAARTAVETVAERLTKAVDSSLVDIELIDALHQSFAEASERIYSLAQSTENLRGMACSLIAAVWQAQHFYIAHAGDSRAYLLYEGALSQVTVDDTPVGALIKRGYLLPEKARSHNLKNFLIKSVGTKSTIDANITKLPAKTGDELLFCSDGLWSVVENDMIKHILLLHHDPYQACRHLIQAAINQGAPDNITVIIVKVQDPIDSLSKTTITSKTERSV